MEFRTENKLGKQHNKKHLKKEKAHNSSIDNEEIQFSIKMNVMDR